MFKLDHKLREYATNRQWELLEALEKYGNIKEASQELKIHHSNIVRARQSVYTKAAIHGYAPDHDLRKALPAGFKMKGFSTLRDAQTGDAKIVWEKAVRDDKDIEQVLRDAIEAMCEDITPLRPAKAPCHTHDTLCNLYTFSDYHMGMLAWHKEGGHDWDLNVAERVLIGCFSQMIANAPNAKVAVINQLGDFLHFDGMEAKTPTSGHDLDASASFSQVIASTIKCLRIIIDMALEKHEHVHVIMAEGNHDLASSIWLRQMFTALYENEPRISVNNNELPYYAYQHGQTSLFFHHGHMRKMPQLGGLFAAQFPQIWGNTSHRYGHCGHLHHKITMSEKEDMGITLIQHPTLASRDAYASRHGWHSNRRALCYTYHVQHGEVGSNNVTPEMIDDFKEVKKRAWSIK